MSKRRISNQQSLRIQKNQKKFHEHPQSAQTGIDGLVITRFKQHAEIEDIQGRRINCAIRPNIESIVAGDRVIWLPEGENQGSIVSCYPRQSELIRADKYGKMKPAAANITQIVIVVAPKPSISWLLLDSYLVMAENLNLKALILLNKIDLPSDELQAQLRGIYTPLGYSILFTNTRNTDSLKVLADCFHEEVSVIAGQSGVGKSSLIKRLLPNQEIESCELSALTDLGQHTTSYSKFYHLPQGGALIDSPGVREFGLATSTDALYGFPELRILKNECKFRNCNHIDAPGCAILKAIENGTVAKQRYDNFLKIKLQITN